MYDAFYGFREKPFSLLPDPEYLYLSPQHEKALGLLELSLRNQAGFCVISGEIGAGKTTLIRKLLTMVGPEFRVGLVSNTLDSFGDLMNWILAAYDLPGGGSPVEQHERYLEFVIRQYARGLRTVLIIDEAQNLGVDALEELRMLSNVNADKDQVLQVILVGQAGLRQTLKRPELAQFAQRILMDFHLGPLGREDTVQYIRHRLLVAGADPQLFTADAASAVFRYSGGVPRIINLLCDTALVYGYAENCPVIEADLIHTVARERQSTSAPPALRLAAVAPPVTDAVDRVRGLGVVPATPAPVVDVPESAPAPEDTPPAATVPVAAPVPGDGDLAAAPPESAAPAPDNTAVAEPGDADLSPPATNPADDGDAEWLRRLADSALPAALRTTRDQAAPPEAPAPARDNAPGARQPVPVVAPRRRPGLGRAAGLLILVAAGATGFWLFNAGEADPVATSAVAEEAAVPDPAPGLLDREAAAAQTDAPAREPVGDAPRVSALPEPEPDTRQEPLSEPVEVAVPVETMPADEAPGPAQALATEPMPTTSEAAPVPAPVRDSAPARPALKPEPVTAVAPAPEPAPEVATPAVAPPAMESRPTPAPAPTAAVPATDTETPAVDAPPAALPVVAAPPQERAPMPVVESEPAVAESRAASAEQAPAEPVVKAPEPTPFTTDPCKGPAARYLSTCR